MRRRQGECMHKDETWGDVRVSEASHAARSSSMVVVEASNVATALCTCPVWAATRPLKIFHVSAHISSCKIWHCSAREQQRVCPRPATPRDEGGELRMSITNQGFFFALSWASTMAKGDPGHATLRSRALLCLATHSCSGRGDCGLTPSTLSNCLSPSR